MLQFLNEIAIYVNFINYKFSFMSVPLSPYKTPKNRKRIPPFVDLSQIGINRFRSIYKSDYSYI